MFSLLSAFEIQPPALVSIVGGGGKTSLLFSLAAMLPGRVVITTTTRIFAVQMKLAKAVCYPDNLDRLEEFLNLYRSCLVVGKVKGDKALGVDPSLPGEMLNRPDVDYVLVEADGSRMRPIKAPAKHEPVVPDETTLLVPMVGIDALNGRLQDVAHRPELVQQLLGDVGYTLALDESLTVEEIAALITHPQGGMKNAPEQARIIPLINKVETKQQLSAARQISRIVLHEPKIERVVIGAMKQDQPVKEIYKRVTAVVLAAGEAKRMGETKQLLPWGDTTVLGQTLRNLKQSAVHEILVVSGHEAEAIDAVVNEEGVIVIHNPDYATGEMLSSLKTPVRQLRPQNAVLVVLADQPMVEPQSIDKLLQAYWQGKGKLIAPAYDGQRGNPVLIDSDYYDELLALPLEAAPRDLLKRHERELYLVAIDSDSVLRDLDRLEDYQRWRP